MSSNSFVDNQAKRNLNRYAKAARDNAESIIRQLEVTIMQIDEGRFKSIERIYGLADSYNHNVGRVEGALDSLELINILQEDGNE